MGRTLERIPGSIGGFHAKGISNDAVRHRNWFFVTDERPVSIDAGFACGKRFEGAARFED
jgi:hypothetical protein